MAVTLPLTLLLAAGCAASRAAAVADAPAPATRGHANAPPAQPLRSGEEGATPPPAPRPAGDGRGVVVAPAAETPAPAPTAIAPAPGPLQAAAGVKAGEWDDNANYREFVRWLASEEGVSFHHVDVGERRFLVVRDEGGQAVPRCKVTVSDAAQRSVELTTVASGRAILFPHAEGLQGRELTATARCQGATASVRFDLDAPDGMIDLKLPVKRVLPAKRTVDVAFILDTTGSMSEEIAAVKSTLQQVVGAIGKGDGVEVRLGMVAFKDRGDEYVTRVFPMTTDEAAFERSIAGIYASGGGDMPESVNEGLHAAMARLDWQNDAIGNYAFLIGDAPPHLDYAQDFDYAAEMKDAAHRGIQIFTIAASGMDVEGQVVWRQVAAYTGATNLFVLRGGAGPQSTGAGDPRSSCGGTQTQYTSGNLDELILAKVRHELGAVDRDPTRIPGLDRDEDAKPCAERLMATD